jgi:L-ascorbate metabolism protein UlaG (beta-lactamase superfamily)
MTQEKSDHFDGRRFVNPAGAAGQPFSAVGAHPRAVATASSNGRRCRYHHIHRPLDVSDSNRDRDILTDPMYSERASPISVIGPRRVRPPAVALDDLPPISTMLLSHNHYDHCDLPTLSMLARRFNPVVVTPLGNAALVRSSGLRRVEELDWWQEAKDSALPITLTPAQHFSARNPFDRNRALWGGFMLRAGGARIYFAGDTAYGSFFRDVRLRLGAIDLALLPIGAYEPRWFMQSVHMNPAEAVQAHLDLEASESIGMHFGTFQLTTEGIDEPLRALEESRRVRNILQSRFRTLGFGESMRL